MNLYPLLAAAVGGEIIDLVGETGPVAKVVLLILLIFSLVSWAIILSKWSVLRRARVQSGRFVRAFRKAQRLQDVGAVAEQFRPSPLVLSLIHISEPTSLLSISYAVFCL